MKVLLIGSGGREHALYMKLRSSRNLSHIDVTPGNGGIVHSIALPGNGSPEAIAQFVKEQGYDLVIVGPEQPLIDGVVDALDGIAPAFGPSRAAAMLEGSKEFAKSFMKRHNIPTADAQSFTSSNEALAYLYTRPLPIVIKADGLAAGKGVTVATTIEQAELAIIKIIEHRIFGDAGSSVLIEDFLSGEELSVFALCDGERAIPMQAAQDHKRAFDGDQGPNTGGMGAYTPVPIMTPELMERTQNEILNPVVQGMKAEGTPYRGLLYAGLMVDNGTPKVVEFNVRFGDPETQALLLQLDEDLLELCHQSACGSLPDRPLRFKAGTAIVVVLAADGYPGDYQKYIDLTEIAYDLVHPEGIVFHAGTTPDPHNPKRILSNGGRILNICANGTNLAEARSNAYAILNRIARPGTFYRRDIGHRHLAH